MLRLLKRLWLKLRVPKRLYKYGTLGLKWNDDRSRAEKFCDMVDNWLERCQTALKRNKARTSQVWHSYQDMATGRVISSMADIRQIEKDTGLVATTFGEVERECGVQARNNKVSEKRMVRNKMSEIMHNVTQGKSYVADTNRRIREGQYEIGNRPTMN